MLIRIGAYVGGSDAELDEAIDKKEQMEGFMKQSASLQSDFNATIKTLIELMSNKGDLPT